MTKRRSPRRASPATPRTRLDVDARRAQLLALGLDIFAARAYDDVPIDEIARAAGISKGLLFHYFPSKRHYYVATIREAARDLLAQTTAEHVEGPIARLEAGLDAYIAYISRHGPAYAAMLRGGIGSDPEVSAVVEETRGIFLARLMKGMPAATPTPLLRTALRAWLGFVEAAAIEWIERRDIAPTALRTLMIDTLVTVMRVGGVPEDAASGPVPTAKRASTRPR
jgi:AcrR family transcriptional regulator